jgi:two-component sensor histidine kinase
MPSFEAPLLLREFSHRINNELASAIGMISFRNSGGLIRVELSPSLSYVECRVTDNGTSEANTRPGHGLKIVEALAQSLGGTIDQRFGPHGATAVLIFPAEIDTTVVEAAAPEARLSSAVL